MAVKPHDTSTNNPAPSDEAVNPIDRPGAIVTPMMVQYMEIKAAHPDCLLFYRMGDFYELFFEDAVAAAAALDIQLTKRGKHLGRDIPMCGVPAHAADDYLQRLIKLGFRVAVCEQLEDPSQAKKRGSKAVVKRNVVRLVTAGTLTEDSLLDARENNYLLAIAHVKAERDDAAALAWIDISTGEFVTTTTSTRALASEIARLEPREIIMSGDGAASTGLTEFLDRQKTAVTLQPASLFDSTSGKRRLKQFFKVSALEGFGEFTRAELAACGAVLGYVELTQIGAMPSLKPPTARTNQDYMQIDLATRSNLELTVTTSGAKTGSLLSVIDHTVTGAGARKLKARLTSPSLDPKVIDARLDAVEFFLGHEMLRGDLRTALSSAPDLNRALARITVSRGGPRDLGAIRDSLSVARDLLPGFENASGVAGVPEEIAASLDRIGRAKDALCDQLADVLGPDLPPQARDGGFVRSGFRKELDDARALRDESRQFIAGLQADYAALADVKSLKIKHNNILGYFVEVTAQNGDRLLAPPLNETFIHRQTLASAMRFTTGELADLEAKIMAAANRAQSIELGIFEHFADLVVQNAHALTEIADGLAELDLYGGLAELAARSDYARPRVDNSLVFSVIKGRHPVVEQALHSTGKGPFVPNDCKLDGETGGSPQDEVLAPRLWLLTGPNMAGKSTFLRQNALIAILAQTGSYVPAMSAHIGVVDQVFSRVGAADDLARGRSTFMVEMVETATILNQAGARSLVILDEIGRGTATFDGLSLAWACVEYLHEINQARTLFATHFHELTVLSNRLAGLANITMAVREHAGEVIFLHEVVPGAADRSYGIQVAKLAGLPSPVLERAGEVLSALERQDRRTDDVALETDLPLFAAQRPAGTPAPEAGASQALDRLRDILPDTLSPREALDVLYELKAITDDSTP